MVKAPANLRFWLASAVLLALTAVGVWSRAAGCGPYRSDKKLTVNDRQLAAEVARDYQSQTRGLAGRPCIGDGQAMLFMFSQPGYYPFWMRDMHFAIDIAWISSGHQVVDTATQVAPSTYPRTFVNAKPAQYVLEVKAGQLAKLGIGTGSSINF